MWRSGISRREVQTCRVGDPGVGVAGVVLERAGGDVDVVVDACLKVSGRVDGDGGRA